MIGNTYRKNGSWCLPVKFVCVLALLSFCVRCVYAGNPKREFRGAWIQCVNGQFQGLSTHDMQNTLSFQLDELRKDGVNAIIFQVRPECDALYESPYEPWSRFLTGVQGKAPSPYWDPLRWMVEECHKRGMELHAWINPFRAKTKGTSELASSHIAVVKPELTFRYDGLILLNPAFPENREYICKIADDIVRRYDIDGLHIDDYFYPYPVSGIAVPDDMEYKIYGKGFTDVGDWRRDNVNVFIQQLSDSIHKTKPWVKFGVSPFGIYRNESSAPGVGSKTRGLQNYDDLYADVLKWVNNGWIDYCVPQLYWEIGHKSADYKELITWWNRHAGNRPLYIGEDVERTVKNADPQNQKQNQQPAKYALHRQLANVDGTVLWYAKAVADNIGNYGAMLRSKYWETPALQPLMPFIDNKAPKKPRRLKPVWTSDGLILFWQTPKAKKWDDEVRKYVVYKFEKGDKINLDDASKIVEITSDTKLRLPYLDGSKQYNYVVTSLDRMNNESAGAKKKVKL